MEIPSALISEDWKKEYEKIILSRKYSKASSLIGLCSSSPTVENVKIAYGAILDYVTSIPLPEDKKLIKKRKKFLRDLDNIGLVLFGTESEKVRKLEKKYKVFRRGVRQGIRIVHSLQNIPNLVKELRNVLIKAGEFATSSGLRVTLATRRKLGLERILEEEGFKDLEV